MKIGFIARYFPALSETFVQSEALGVQAAGDAVRIAAGTYVGLGVGWNCSATYYGDYSGWSGTYEYGDFIQTYWDNSYPGYSPTYAPTNTGTNPDLAYYSLFGYAP